MNRSANLSRTELNIIHSHLLLLFLSNKYILGHVNMPTPRWCLYFDVVVGLAGSNDPESYSDGSIATGRVTQAGQVEGDDPD
jgi:hypothetical protein